MTKKVVVGLRSGRAARSGAALAAALVSWPLMASAHSGGTNSGDCSGCHGVGTQMLSLSTNPASVSPGQTVTVAINVQASSGSVAGLFVQANAGSLDPIGGQGLFAVGSGLTHSSPRSLSGGETEFSFEFNVPGGPGAVRFEVWNVVGNGNGSSGGDGATDSVFDVVYGCASQQFFRDHDGDGFGRDSEPLLHCAGAAPAGYAADGADCDDNRDTVFPGATEYCNTRDDDCDGEVDEQALPVEQFPDADGDGFYGSTEALSDDIFVGCVPTEGYAGEPGDCAPEDGAVHPEAEEVCNLLDDNCDNRVDEGVRPTCGEGWCRRAASTCEDSTCYPGEAELEQCNYIDDDCNGIVDDGDLCDAGQRCVGGECQVDDSGGSSGSSGGPTTGSTSATGGTATDTASQDGPSVVNSQSCGVVPSPTSELWLWTLCLLTARRRRGATLPS